MASGSSQSRSEGTPEGIFGVFADEVSGPGGPWLFGEPLAPVIPASWLLSTHWSATFQTGARGGAERVRLSQEELATPGVVMQRLPRTELADIAEQCVEARSRIGSWDDLHLGEVYEDVLAEARALRIGEVPLLISTLKRLRRFGYGPDDPLASALDARRRDILEDGAGALALVDLEMLLGHWLTYRSADATWQRMTDAQTLTDHAQAFATRFASALTAVSIEPTEIIRRRGWGGARATLEELGSERGVTRERMRQILVVADKRLGERRWPLSPAVEAATLRILGGSEQELSRDPWSLDDEESGWTADALVDLLSCLGHRELSARVREAWANRKDRPADDVVGAVRDLRDRLGFVDLSIIRSNPQVAKAGHDPLSIVRWIYPRVASHGDFVLAGTEGATPAERIAGQQFFVTAELTISELREGFARVARKRAQPLPPPEPTLLRLLKEFGALAIDGEIVTGPPSPLDEGSVQMWLYELIDSAPGGILHSEDIVRAAIRDQKNISSVMNYVSYEPIVRRFDEGSGLIRLVGRKITFEAAEIASRIATAQRRPTRLDITVGATSTHLTLEVGSALLKNGVLYLQPEAVAIWPQSGVRVVCICGTEFKGWRKVLGGSNVTGWQTPLVHLVLEHGLQEGDTVRFDLVDEVLKITDIGA